MGGEERIQEHLDLCRKCLFVRQDIHRDDETDHDVLQKDEHVQHAGREMHQRTLELGKDIP